MSDRPIEISQFFDERTDTYEEHMRQSLLSSFSKFYGLISSPIARTSEPISILDLGCGTGLELESVFSRAPGALVTGVDVSKKMLCRLRDKYQKFLGQIELVEGPFEMALSKEKEYDYALSVMTLHHLPPSPKGKLYKKVCSSLKDKGKYIEGAYVVSRRKEKEFLSVYEKIMQNHQLPPDKTYHIDVPCSVETQIELLSEAGFSEVRTIWKKRQAAIFVAETG